MYKFPVPSNSSNESLSINLSIEAAVTKTSPFSSLKNLISGNFVNPGLQWYFSNALAWEKKIESQITCKSSFDVFSTFSPVSLFISCPRTALNESGNVWLLFKVNNATANSSSWGILIS